MSKTILHFVCAPLAIVAQGVGWYYGDFCIGLIAAMSIVIFWQYGLNYLEDKETTRKSD